MPVPTSAYTPIDDVRFAFFVPLPILHDPPRFTAQARTALQLLGELNRRITGNPREPCQKILVFNHDLTIEDDA